MFRPEQVLQEFVAAFHFLYTGLHLGLPRQGYAVPCLNLVVLTESLNQFLVIRAWRDPGLNLRLNNMLNLRLQPCLFFSACTTLFQ